MQGVTFKLFDMPVIPPAPVEEDNSPRVANFSSTLATPVLKLRPEKSDTYGNFSGFSNFSGSLEPSRHTWVTPDLRLNFRASRPWLLENLDELLAHGWTRGGLFRIKKPLGHPYSWGVAWSSWWATAVDVEVLPGGGIGFVVVTGPGRTNTLVAQPR